MITTVSSLIALICLAASIAAGIQGPDPIRPLELATLCCLSFAIGMLAQREIVRWESRFRRPEDSDLD
jgi:hypothetical protein